MERILQGPSEAKYDNASLRLSPGPSVGSSPFCNCFLGGSAARTA